MPNRIKLYLGDDRSRQLKLQSKPILNWTNALNNSIHGRVFVWTSNGRPQVVASVMRYFKSGGLEGEFQSFATQKLVGVFREKIVWSPEYAPETKRLPGDVKPTDSAARRLIQMRQIARNFSVTHYRENEKAGESKPSQLRVLNQPIFRYESAESNVIDGALFAFTTGTDPELILMLEALDKDGAILWHYTIGRLNSRRLEVKYDDESVWSGPQLSPPFKNVYDPKKPYRFIGLK